MDRKPRLLAWTIGAMLPVAAGLVLAQAPAARTGASLFQARCAECHGIDAKGVHGPDLTSLFASGATDDRVFQTIRRGIAGTEMPASTAPDEEIRAIVAYLRTLRAAPPEPIQGDARHGETIFRASCAACHQVAGRGGHLGPDLSRIGSSRSPAMLVRKIRNAAAVVAPG